MITDFDDYMIHQTSDPVTQPASSDRNFYDRYWFNGFDGDRGVRLRSRLWRLSEQTRNGCAFQRG